MTPADPRAGVSDCAGCSWIASETGRYRELTAGFRAAGAIALAELAEGGMAALEEDRRRHFLRDHPDLAGEPANVTGREPEPLAIRKLWE